MQPLDQAPANAGRGRPRGRPPRVSREGVIAQIREIAARGDGLFRIHRAHPDLYARARRYFGSWEAAVRHAGLDYESAVRNARERSRIPLRRTARGSREGGRSATAARRLDKGGQ